MIITSVKLSAGENEVYIDGSYGERFRITVSDAKKAGILKYIDNEELLPEEADEQMLSFMSEKLSCIKYAEYLLGFGDKSKKMLMLKLKTKGYTSEICEAAIDVLEKNHIVDDENLCRRKLEALANTKYYGPYRLKSELLQKGFSSKQIDIVLDEAEIDFDELLNKLFEKLTKRGFEKDRKSVVSLKNKLSRYGYDYDRINDVVSRLECD